MKPFPIVTDIIMAIAFAGIGFLHARRLSARGFGLGSGDTAKKARVIMTLGLFFIFANTALLVLRSDPSLAWHLPVVVEYCANAATWSTDVAVMSFIFAAVVFLAFRERHRFRWVLVAAALAAIICGEYAFRSSSLAAVPTLGRPRLTDSGIVLQTTTSSCAAATCANIARFYGIEKSERDMVDLLGTTVSGTTPSQIVLALQRLGLHCTKRYCSDLDLDHLKPPAILFTGIPTVPDSHVVAFMGYDDDYITILDPMNGKIPHTKASVREMWQGRAIEISR